MSKHNEVRRLTARHLREMKKQNRIVTLTAYSAPVAAMLDAHVDAIIVGDSMGMVLYGMDSTLGVDLDMMIRHGQTVVAHTKRACVIVDLPFGSYQTSPKHAFIAAARVMKETGCQAVKLEGGMEMVETVQFLVERGIPVMAHIGLKPQHVQTMGGYVYQGRGEAAKKRMMQEALAHEKAGAFALLLEGTAAGTAKAITAKLSIPTVGIGASVHCDGQVLVTEDMLGLFERTPRFVKTYASLRKEMDKAFAAYAKDVRAAKFPSSNESVE